MLQMVGSASDRPAESRGGRLQRSLIARWIRWVPYPIAACGLGYALWHLRLGDLRDAVSSIVWWPVVIAIALQVIIRVMQALRWRYILRPIQVRPRVLLHAVYVGTFANGVLPMCPSDLVRAVLVARRTRNSTFRVISCQGVERIGDGMALMLVGWLAVRGMNLPAALHQALLVLLGVVAVGAVVIGVLRLQHRRLRSRVIRREPRGRIGRTTKKACLDILEGTGSVRNGTLPVAAVAGLAMVFLQALTMWLLFYAYHIDLSLLHAAAVFSIIIIGTMIPSAPASIGAWQFFCILGLSVLGVPASQAAGFSLIAFALWTVPSVLIGGIVFLLSPVKWADLKPSPIPATPGSETQPA